MAGLGFSVGTTKTKYSCAANTRQTQMQLKAPTNQGVLVGEWGISFDGDDPTHAGVLVELEFQDATGAGSVGGSVTLTPGAKNPDDSEAIQSTAKGHFTGSTQPLTVSAAGPPRLVSPQGGYVFVAGSEDEKIKIPAGMRLGIVVTAPDAVNCTPWFDRCTE